MLRLHFLFLVPMDLDSPFDSSEVSSLRLSDLESHVSDADVAKITCTFYTSKQREFIFAALIMARANLGSGLTGLTDKRILELAKEKLCEWSSMSRIHRPPTDKTFRALWKQFLDPNGVISKIYKSGAKLKDTGVDLPLEHLISERDLSTIM